MMNKSSHPFHLVDQSPWPLIISFMVLLIVSSLLEMMHCHSYILLSFSLLLTTFVSMLWWRDVTREGKLQGLHLKPVVKGLKWGMILFIISEVLFFLSFFWTFFHMSLSPHSEMGGWPPIGVMPFNFMEIPLLNTIILLTSGVSITWAHKSMLSKKYLQATFSLTTTIILGFIFTVLQGFEYLEASYSFADSSYGASFFIATGFHGLHIIIGSVFLVVMNIRLMNNSFSSTHHFGFEAASWYWHFVDVIWLFLFSLIYWWALVLIILIFSLGLAVILFMVMIYWLLSKKTWESRDSLSPFECGFESLLLFRSPLSLRFFFILLMFLIFDIEIVMIMPMVLSAYCINSLLWWMIAYYFITLLGVGLLMEWSMGSIQWS